MTSQTVYPTLHQEIVYSIAFSSRSADHGAEGPFHIVKDNGAQTS